MCACGLVADLRASIVSSCLTWLLKFCIQGLHPSPPQKKRGGNQGPHPKTPKKEKLIGQRVPSSGTEQQKTFCIFLLLTFRNH